MSRPLPPHGSYARANGSPGYRPPCKCEPCIKARRAKKKTERVNRQLGRAALIDPTTARNHIAHLRKTMGWKDIAAAGGFSERHLYLIGTGQVPSIRQDTLRRIMAIKPVPTRGMYIDATGSIRRARALQAKGHSIEAIAAAADAAKSRIQPVVAGQPVVRRLLADRIDKAYRLLARQDGTSVKSRNRAAREAWAPPGAWDDDTIDDPNAHPDWTGYCGTDRGYWVHTLQKLTVCARCLEAHERWVADHAHLTRKDRAERLFAQRAVASTREAALAEDARELLRLEIPVDVAAARLGVTRNHLQQAMKRHPERLDTAA